MGHRGNILEGDTALASFTNIMRDANDTEPPEEGAVTTLSVTKRLEGKLVKSDSDKEFNIVL